VPVRATARIVALATIALLACACLSNGNKATPSATVPPGPPNVTRLTPAGTSNTAYPLTVRRSDGKSLTIKAPPRRIASLSAGTTEILYAIGADQQIAATDKYSDYPEAAKKTPKLDGFNPSVEAVAAVAPDLVVMIDNPNNVVQALDGLGISVLYLKVPTSVAELLQQIQFYGDVTGHPTQAQRVAASIRARLDAVQRKVAGVQQGPRVYHELDPKLFTAAPSSFVGDLYTLLKAQNIAPAGDKPYPQLTQEQIIANDPEVIVLADAVGGESADTVKARPGWGAISAVKNNRVYSIDGDLVSRPGPRIADGLEALAKILYPERF
jgi:iron complex transport system substrate-binding protein